MTASDEAAFVRALGGCIRVLRLDRGLSQEQLADAAGVSKLFISAAERGLHAANIVNLFRVANALRVPLAVLVDEAADPSPVLAGSARPAAHRSGGSS